jgi:hypothetical protein
VNTEAVEHRFAVAIEMKKKILTIRIIKTKKKRRITIKLSRGGVYKRDTKEKKTAVP